MKTLLEKCDSFLDALPYDFYREFVDKYCNGQMYNSFMKRMPDEFVKSVLQFSMNHMDNDHFQDKATRHIGSTEVRTGLITDKKAETIITGENELIVKNKTASIPQKSPEPHNLENIKPSELKSEPRHKTHGQLFSPVHVHSDDELRRSIGRKLFSEPRDHDRYTRLTSEEKRFILRYAGLSKKERDIFEEKCDKNYFPYRKIATRLRISESLVKKRAVRIDEHIRRMLEN